MNAADAIEAIDTYGVDKKLWPAALRRELDQIIKSDPAVAAHHAAAVELERELEAWQDDDDGAEFEDEEEDSDAGELEAQPIDPEDLIEIPVDFAKILDMDNMLAGYIQTQISESAEQYRVFTKDFDEFVDVDVEGAFLDGELTQEEIDKARSERMSLDPITQATAKAVGPLQKELTRLIAAKTAVTRLPGQRRGKLHGASLHRILAGDDRLFTRKQEAQALDTAISLVIDCSGSMCGQRFILAMQAAFAVGTVLHRIKVPFEVIGYTTGGFKGGKVPDNYWDEVAAAAKIAPIARAYPLAYPKFKLFNEPWSLEIQRRFAAAHNADNAIDKGGTIEGCAVEMAGRRLLAQPQKRKMMIVLSDGEPGGAAYSPELGSGIYKAHAKQAVKDIERAGIDILGVGIMNKAITKYYTRAVAIENVTEMPAILLAALKGFIVG